MKILKNHILEGRHQRSISLDVYCPEGEGNKKIIVFCHGFKGFKDWGHWEAIAEAFVAEGFYFLKFNFSHNGVVPNDWLNFGDLEAFGQNNYTKELDDLQTVLDWVQKADQCTGGNLKIEDIILIGHSRGGPIALIGAAENPKVSKVMTWAGVHELDYSWDKEPNQLEQWQTKGVHYIKNGRTKQDMPVYVQLYEDYQANKARFSTRNTLQKLNIPYLILHGDKDPAVPLEAAYYLHENAKNAQLEILPNANHVFGGSHPFEKADLPEASQLLLQKSIAFAKMP